MDMNNLVIIGHPDKSSFCYNGIFKTVTDKINSAKNQSIEIIDLYRGNDELAVQVMDEYFERTARSFSTFVNILDPEVIVCGGGMSEIDELYDEVPKRIIPYIASNFFLTPMVKAEHGSSSGVRGAAYLWG